MSKQQSEQVFSQLIEDVEKCYGNPKKMERLYKDAKTVLNQHYNSILKVLIKQRLDDLSYVDANGGVYL